MLPSPIRRTTKSSTAEAQSAAVSDTVPFALRHRCLVLDDEFLIALDIQQILESAGANVICVSSAAKALEAIQNGPPFDLAVLDVKLAGEAGGSITVAATLAAQGTPFVFLTGLRGEAEHTRSFPQAPVVEKPYETATLLAALRRAT